MANKIVETNIRATRFVESTSRYANSDVIYYGSQNKLTFKTYKRQTLPSSSDRFTVIPNNMEYRPDLLSSKIYGVPDFWWKIMEVNKIFDIFDFKAGINIRIPANIF